MRIGYIGSQKGMTVAQMVWVSDFIAENSSNIEAVVHADSIGAEDEFDRITRKYAKGFCVVEIHPPVVDDVRAWANGGRKEPDRPKLKTIVHKPRPLVLRYCDVVENSDLVLIAPRSRKPENGKSNRDTINESELWFAYSYANKAGVNINLILPDGKVEKNGDLLPRVSVRQL